jgi:hypothetical protein
MTVDTNPTGHADKGPEPAARAVIGQIIERASSPDFEQWWAQLAGSGFCGSPVHLIGHGGGPRPVEVMGRCKNRRAAVCPSCSALYAGDTWQLVHAGIVGGHHGLPATIANHPMIFATLTAPSFGAVHSASLDPLSGRPRPCHPVGAGGRCHHRCCAGCTLTHAVDDEAVGQPLCHDCYDYIGHVLFTWHAPDLWHRFTIRLRRAVANRLCQLGEDAKSVRVSYVKVVELQRRAVPHFHAVVRLDAVTGPGPPEPPETVLSAVELAALVAQTVTAVRLNVSGPTGSVVSRFGAQADVQPLRTSTITIADRTDDPEPEGVSARRVAAYLAKYVTKSVADFGLGARRISDQAIDELPVNDHTRRILWTIVQVAELPDHRDMVTWLHTLGYRGHITSKTRRYSTTMGALLARREAWRQHQQTKVLAGDDSGPDENEPSDWQFAGYGHANHGDRLLALSAAARVAEMRQVARDEFAKVTDDHAAILAEDVAPDDDWQP